MSKRGNALTIVLIILLALASSTTVLFYLRSAKILPPTSPSSTNSEATIPSQNSQISNKYFLSAPPALGQIGRTSIPNLSRIGGAGQFEGKLWLVGDGKVVEFDPIQNKITHVSSDFFGFCYNNLAILGKHLYFSCHSSTDFGSPLTLYKVNLNTLTLEKTFNQTNGLGSDQNYYLLVDDNMIWLATFDGVGRIDNKDNVTFYKSELGINATSFEIGRLLADSRSIWVYVTANAYSQGGIARFDKQTQKWFAFGPNELTTVDQNRFDALSIGKTPDGLLVSTWENSNQGGVSSSVCTVKKFTYSSNKFTAEPSESNFDSCRAIPGDANEGFPLSLGWHEQTDPFGLNQLTNTDNSGQQAAYQIDGRVILILSQEVNNKRYALTNATVDKLDQTTGFSPKIVAKLGGNISVINSTQDLKINDGILNFFVDQTGKYAIVTSSGCTPLGEMPSCLSPEVWLIDLQSEKLLKKYSSQNAKLPTSENLTGTLALTTSANALTVIKESKPIFRINLPSFALQTL